MAWRLLFWGGMLAAGCVVPETLTTDKAAVATPVTIVNECSPFEACPMPTATTQPPFGDLTFTSTTSTQAVNVVAKDPNPDTLLLKARIFRQQSGRGPLFKSGIEDFIAMDRDPSDPSHERFLGDFGQISFCGTFGPNNSIWIVVTNSTFVGNTDSIATGTCCADRKAWHLICPGGT